MDVRPLHAVLIVTLAIVLVGLAAYGGSQARRVLGPSDLRVDRSNQLHLRIGPEIFVYDSGYALVDTYSLKDFGVTGLLGSFDFFSDNSLLLAADSLAGGAAGQEGRLLRCSRESNHCVKLAGAGQKFQWSFRVFVDDNDDLFLADTADDSVYWLDAQGRERDRLPGKVEQPGQVRRQGDRLAVANTNGREILLVPLEDGHFAAKGSWRHILLDSDLNRSRGERRPTDFIHLDSGWYILAKTPDGRRGSVYHYSDEGGYRARIALPDGADPLAIAHLGGSILVADYAGMKVYRFTETGKRLADLESPAQRQHIEGLQHRKRVFSVLEYTSWGIFATALLAGFSFAIRGELRKARNKKGDGTQAGAATASTGPTSRPHPMEAGIHWLVPKKTALWAGLLALGAVLAMPLLLEIGLPESEDPRKLCARFSLNIVLWGFTLSMLVIFIPLLLKMRTTVNTRLGFRDEWVLVDHGNGSTYIARDADLIAVNNGFMIEGVTIPTGNPRLTLYDSRELEAWLQPRLARGNALGPIQQLNWQWQNRRGLVIVGVIGICAGLALVVALETGWMETQFKGWLETRPECRELPGESEVT